METYTLLATSASAQSNGVTTTADGATIVIGGVAPNTHALLRFDSSSIVAADVIMQANLTATVTAVGTGPNPDIIAWASDFGASISNASYDQAANNNPTGYRVQLSVTQDPFLVGASAIATTVGNQPIPTRFVRQLGSAPCFSDFELRPAIATASATDQITIAGAGAVS